MLVALNPQSPHFTRVLTIKPPHEFGNLMIKIIY
jgi:hypothetical protein